MCSLPLGTLRTNGRAGIWGHLQLRVLWGVPAPAFTKGCCNTGRRPWPGKEDGIGVAGLRVPLRDTPPVTQS